MKLHFMKGEGSGSDLQVAVSGWVPVRVGRGRGPLSPAGLGEGKGVGGAAGYIL